MYISKFRVFNYKSFYESERLELGPGFNIVVGANNVGKTAFLEALGLRFSFDPHRSPKTVPYEDVSPDPTSWVELSLTVARDELLDLLHIGNDTYWIPMADYNSEISRVTGLQGNSLEARKRFVRAALDQASFTFELKKFSNNIAWQSAVLPSFGLYPPLPEHPGDHPSVSFRVGPGRVVNPTGDAGNVNHQTELGARLGAIFERYVYKFSAERFNLGITKFGNNAELARDAQNLPEVLNSLQANKDKFEEFNRFVRDIFPHVQWISTQPAPNGQVEARIWVFDPKAKRLDLARPLRESGTGIGQVLAILYVAINSVRPQVIIIDEPQSFLHPGAVRKLIEVLKTNTRHQYILSSHSPTVITSCNPSTVTLVRLVDGESHLEPIDPRETRAASIYLSEIGARLSDVFGADDFLWVEGATEEMCFPAILEKIAKTPLMGTAIVGVRQVGDFEGRDARRVLEIYNRLCQSKSLVPPAIGFLFDSECRTAAEKSALSKLGKDRVFFLQRRMFENYLLNPEAIASILNRFDDSRQTPVQPEEVRTLIEQMRTDENLFRPAPLDPSDTWSRHIHAGKMLDRIFSQLSETRVAFAKPLHSFALVEWVIENNPEELREVASVLTNILKKLGQIRDD